MQFFKIKKYPHCSSLAYLCLILLAFQLTQLPALGDISSMIETPKDVSAVSADAVVTDSGLASKVLVAGDGKATPAAADTVTVHYVGMLNNGVEFDNSYTHGVPFTFTVGTGEVIEGWDKGILGMKVGGTRILIIPAEMAYGNRGNSSIPPNSTLLFAVELLEVK
jgi:peptidylprolyl isomerase